jgi:LPS O-antigen subunit length determinant protein (WzzB/FepE family)
MESMALSESAQRKEYYKRELIRAKKELDGVTDYRDMKVRESVLAVIINQLEVATLDGARETLIQVAEVAAAPEKRSFPKRGIIVIASTLAGLLFAIGFIFIRRTLKLAAAEPEQQNRWQTFKNAWRLSRKAH